MLYKGLTVAKLGLRTIYAGLKLLPTQNKAVLISRKNRHTSIDFKLLAKEISRQHPDTKVVILNHRRVNNLQHMLETIQEMYHLATAKACVVDAYTIPVSILKHKPELTVVQIWHALGAIKEFGHAVIGRKEGNSQRMANTMKMHHGYTYATAGGRATIPHFSKAFNMPEERIIPIGMPRVDYLVNEKILTKNREELTKRYKLDGRKVILYAPTFRKRGEISPQPLIDAVDYSKYRLIIKQHDHDNTDIKKHHDVIFANDVSSLKLLSITDYVITDYSAVTFEAATLDIPLFFWVYDLEEYQKSRGLNVDYEKDMPGVVSADPKRIIDAIEVGEYNMDNIVNFKHKFVEVLDGTSTKRIVDLLGL